jgi:spore germination protein KC
MSRLPFYIKPIIFVPFLLFLSSCGQISEIDRMLYVHTMGIDYKDGQYVVYAQIINLEAGGRTEQGGGGAGGTSQQATVGKAEGNTVDDALFKLYNAAQRRIFWGHLSSIVLSENLLKEKGIEGVIDALEFFTRYRETRYTMWVLATTSPIMDLLTTFPVLNLSPIFTKLGDPIENYRQSSYVLPVRVNKLILDLNEPGGTAIIPLINTIPSFWVGEMEQNPTLNMEGVAVLDSKDFKGFLKNKQIPGLRWMDTETVRNDLPINIDNKPAALLVLRGPKVKIKPNIQGGHVTFDIEIKTKGTISELYVNLSEAELHEEAEKTIKEKIRKTYKEGLDIKADVYRLSETLYRHDPKEWKRLGFDRNFPLTEDSLGKIDVKVKLTDSQKSKLKRVVSDNP